MSTSIKNARAVGEHRKEIRTSECRNTVNGCVKIVKQRLVHHNRISVPHLVKVEAVHACNIHIGSNWDSY